MRCLGARVRSTKHNDRQRLCDFGPNAVPDTLRRRRTLRHPWATGIRTWRSKSRRRFAAQPSWRRADESVGTLAPSRHKAALVARAVRLSLARSLTSYPDSNRVFCKLRLSRKVQEALYVTPLIVKQHALSTHAAKFHRSFVPSIIGSVSISLRDFTISCVPVLYFLK